MKISRKIRRRLRIITDAIYDAVAWVIALLIIDSVGD